MFCMVHNQYNPENIVKWQKRGKEAAQEPLTTHTHTLRGSSIFLECRSSRCAAMLALVSQRPTDVTAMIDRRYKVA